MKTVLPPIYEDPDNDFDDAFERMQFANNLTNLFRNSDNGLVITLNSEWGGGKTTFIKHWIKKLEEETDFIPIYYDAFKYDFTGDALMSIGATIQSELDGSKKILSDKKNEDQLTCLKENLKKVAINIGKTCIGSGISYLTGGLITNEKIQESISNGVSDILFKPLEIDLDEKLKAFKEMQNIINDYQNNLETITKTESGEQIKIVFFVDELDRCRPNFSIEILEKIKHLFNTKNTYFVLAINKKQLLNTIKHVYGSDNNSATYLQKFIHLETQLPSIHNLMDSQLRMYIDKLLKELGLLEFIKNKNLLQNIFDAFTELGGSNILSLTPRAIERTMTYLAIAIGSCNLDEEQRYMKHLIPMAILKVHDPDGLYRKYSSGTITSPGTQYPKGPQIIGWLRNYYSVGERGVSTDFEVSGLAEACKILDIYSIPEG